MATTQMLLDRKYGRQLLEDRARLSELFSEDILGALFLQERYTIEEILATTFLSVSYQQGLNTSFKGLELLENLVDLGAGNSLGGSVNLSALVKLQTIDFGYCNNLTSVGSLLNLAALDSLYITHSQITSLGSLRRSPNLRVLALNNNINLTFIDIVWDNLFYLDLSNCSIPTIEIDKYLYWARLAKEDGSPLTTLNLAGSSMGIPTGGAANTNYTTLQSLGVTVSIRTT